jgi:hypothetical protein
MRTKLLATAAILAVGLASSTAQNNVYSLNVVGYVNKTLVGGGEYTAVANPLNTTNNTLAGLFGGAGQGLPSTSRVLKWNTTIADFDVYTKTAFGTGWSGPAPGADTSLNPGEGCLVLTPAASGDITNTFVGEVLQGDQTVAMIAGYQLVGNKIPDSGEVTSLQLTNVPTTSRLLKWNTAAQDWDIFTKTAFGTGWSGPLGTTPPSLDVGEGFMLNAVSAFNWVRNFTVGP